MIRQDSRDFLARHLRERHPHLALLRAVEARFMNRVRFVRPVLDVGCGDGHFASAAYDAPIDVGLDLRDRDLRTAAGRGPEVYRVVLRADATALPFRDGAFGTVVSNCAIEHIPDISSTVREIARVLRPGGEFATTLPSECYAEYLLGSTLASQIGLPALGRAYGAFFNRISKHEHVDPPEVWRVRLAGAGLNLVEHSYYFSRGAHRAFDVAHYLGVPGLVIRRLVGQRVVGAVQAACLEGWYRRYYEEPLPRVGAYQFLRCVRA